ncbi:MAG: hypothetical protein DI536_13875 [Archangium gephyra]|uniref:Uncharacterized protein n=1 Tax=Archangium gephyra TaxID=48 RepID=A0A2W5UTZ6_9BACT|nr:MAG: hypothetical protein DI536_13875 [Archangium gephyra]
MLLALVLAAWPAPQATTIAQCSASACTTTGEVRVCKCIPNRGEKRAGITVDGPRERHLEWDVRTVLGDVNDFFVDSVDLDGDDKPETVISSRAVESNGVMIRTWELAIVDGSTDGVTHVVTHDWGRDFLGPKRTLLLAEWANEAGRMVFTGREYRYEKGRLEPTDEPVRRRTYDPTFETERLAAINASDDRTLPARALLSTPSTKKGADALPSKLTTVVVKGLIRDDQLQAHVQAGDELSTIPELRLGDAKKKRLYPLGYAPTDAEDWLVGKTVRRSEGQLWLN